MTAPATVLVCLRRVDCNDGVASYCETIVKGLKARGDRVVLVSGPVTQLYGSATRHAAIVDNVLEWRVCDDLGTGRPRLSTIRSILQIMRTHSVDVISPQGFSLLPVSFVLSKLARRPVVANYHPSMTGASAGSAAIGRTGKMLLAYKVLARLFTADRFIAISNEIASFYRDDLRIGAERVAYIPHGIDRSFFRPPSDEERREARARFGLVGDTLVCVLPGRLNFDKGHDVAIDAIRILRRTHPGVRVTCLFPGGGDQADQIHAYAFADDADAGAFQFLGFLDANAFRKAYWAADIGLLPSRFEGFGMVIAEAMMCGCVPIRTPSGGWDDQIIDGENGYVVPFNDAPALADRIGRLANAEHRAALRERAIAHARGRFDQAVMVAATTDLYRSLAQPRAN